MRALVFALAFSASYSATVVDVHDGDTFTAIIALPARPGLDLGEKERVRLPCGNAAELRADGGGVAAREALKRALGDGGVELRTSWLREKYGRLLAEPLRIEPDGGRASVCDELVDAGMLH